ncbi:helix-turn-helix transcriptional regulator [Streptomyces sp. NPDC088194]|uniref:helix-turn-helix domain-containing protein n=1 Tax=Streptomyces sp. NPDC088194 TaxID=3154931 RepID=UPI00344DDE2E
MSGAAGARETDQFATLLRELKDRSGLSYGGLAKRLHMSTSTLHRYCNGTAVPNEYAPVERLARACRATPQELVELHRRWVLADEARRVRGDQAAATRAEAAASGDAGAGTVAGAAAGPAADSAWAPAPAPAPTPAPAPAPAPDSAQGAGWADPAAEAGAPQTAGTGSAAESDRTAALPASSPEPSPGPGLTAGPAQDADGGPDEPDGQVVVRLPRGPSSPRRRRNALIASAAAAAVLATTALVAHPWDRAGDNGRDQQAVGATASSDTADAKAPSTTPSPTGSRHTRSASPSTPASSSTSGAPQGVTTQGAKSTPTGSSSKGTPLTVGVRPYAFDDPCRQHFLVDSAPAQVGPPGNEQDAPRWAAAYGGVSSGEQRIALTIQGTGSDTVVLQALHVRAISSGAPLAWNDYSMGVGCGGGVDVKTFDIDLDNGSPTATVLNGQRNFPYKVSESDPEVFYVTAHTKAHDVRWDLSLDWSSGTRSGTISINDKGTPFHTSADVDRPGYDYPNGGSDWIKRDS